MIPEEIYDKILRHAVKAPSLLNSQPWKFEIEPGVIHLYPDFSRSLPAIDPCNTNLYISLGCVLENLLLASEQLGYEAIPEIREFPLQTMLSIKLSKGLKAAPSALFDQIGHRQVVRSNYAPVRLSKLLMDKIALECSQDYISIIPLMQKELRLKLIPLVDRGIQILNNQRSYVKEKVHWIRFTEKQAMLKGDGVRASSLGYPFSGTMLSRLFITRQLSKKNELKSWGKLIHHSSGFVLFTTRESQKDQWIKLGRSFQQFVLHLSNAGIQYSHIPLPMEYILLQKQLAELCGAEGKVPLLLIRIGRGKPMSYSFRRNIEQSVTRNSNQ